MGLHHRAEKCKNGKQRRKLCSFFSETPNEIAKTGVFAFCKSPNRIEMHKKCQKGIDFMVDMLYSEDAKTIKEDVRNGNGIDERYLIQMSCFRRNR